MAFGHSIVSRNQFQQSETVVYENSHQLQESFYRPLCRIWEERLAAALAAKARFDKIGRQCNDFFEAGAGFMWEKSHKSEFFSGRLPTPKFKITVAKAYEYVSIYGPHLYWQYAKRKVINQRTLQITVDMFGDPNDPAVQEAFTAVKSQDDIEQAMARFGNEMMGNYLDWSQREQHGGLAVHAALAVTESLVKGMGCLWPQVYSHPGSDQKFTRLQYRTVNNLLVDPDCKDPLLETAGYIALRHCQPIWQVEKLFKLERGSLSQYGSAQSGEQISRENANKNSPNKTFDMIEWWEIWSKSGVGPRNGKFAHDMIDELDETVGDYAYLCIAKGVPFPLNAPPERFFGENAATSESVLEMFEWRCADYGEKFPVWKDAGRWPVSLLSFIKIPNSPWAMAPLSPGLGELIAINILQSAYCDQAWNDRKRIIGYLGSQLTEIKAAIESDDSISVVKINDGVLTSVRDMIQYLDGPARQNDLLQAISMLSDSFDKRVGLTELQYGISSTQVRVASDVRTRSEAANIRPEKFSRDVAAWMSDASQLEMFLALQYVDGVSLTHLLGGYCASQWDALLKQIPLEQAMREMKASVEASDIRRPNHERDTANVQALQQYLTPLLQVYAQASGDNDPLNNFLQKIGESIEMDLTSIKLTRPWAPDPDPEQAELMKAGQEAEVQKTQAQAEAASASAIKFQADAAATMAEIGGGQQDQTGPAEAEHQQSLRHKEEDHNQKLISNNELLTQKLLFNEMEAQIRESALTSELTARKEQAKIQASQKAKAKQNAPARR